MARRPKLTPAAFAEIDKIAQVKGDEVYAPVQHKFRGSYRWSVHVFTRMPNEHEMQRFETTASSVEFRGRRAKVKGSQVRAAVTLYDTLIERVYDMPVGSRIRGEAPDQPLSATEAQKLVDPISKRSAITELTGQTWAGSSNDDDDDDEDFEDDEDADTAR